MITKQALYSRLDDLVVRTERGNELVRRNPRELPRRLRVLLLAIDGTHTVQLYVQTLKGFGDIADLLVELAALGLIRLRRPGESFTAADRTEQMSALDQLLDDSRFTQPANQEVLYGSTAPGSFDEMLRVAKIETVELSLPPAPPPAPIPVEVQQVQVESLFVLLEDVRSERRSLKDKLTQMNQIRSRARQLQSDNLRLTRTVFGLVSVCAALLVVLAWMILRALG
jgi:hypothetical protein